MNYESQKAKRLNALYPNLGKLYDMRNRADYLKSKRDFENSEDLLKSNFDELDLQGIISVIDASLPLKIKQNPYPNIELEYTLKKCEDGSYSVDTGIRFKF